MRYKPPRKLKRLSKLMCFAPCLAREMYAWMLASVATIIVVSLSPEIPPALNFFFLFSLYWPQVCPVVSDALVVPGFHSGRLQGFSELKAHWLFGKPVRSHPLPADFIATSDLEQRTSSPPGWDRRILAFLLLQALTQGNHSQEQGAAGPS